MADENSQKPVDGVVTGDAAEASATSRPIITKGKQLAQDPMISGKTEGETTPQANKDIGTTIKKKIQPLSPPTPSNDSEPEDSSSQDEANASTSNSEAEVNVLAGQVETKNEKQAELSKQDEQANQIHNLISERKYFLPIKSAKKTRKARAILVILLLLCGLGGAYYYAASTGVIPEMTL